MSILNFVANNFVCVPTPGGDVVDDCHGTELVQLNRLHLPEEGVELLLHRRPAVGQGGFARYLGSHLGSGKSLCTWWWWWRERWAAATAVVALGWWQWRMVGCPADFAEAEPDLLHQQLACDASSDTNCNDPRPRRRCTVEPWGRGASLAAAA